MSVEELLQKYIHLSADEAGLALSILLPLLSLLFPPVRRSLKRAVQTASFAIGRPRARYRQWFSREHGTLRNIYLNRLEALSLDDTYVSLSVQSGTGDTEIRIGAAELLAPSGSRRIILVGDPGSGKSTLLKAYGVGILKSKRRHREASKDMQAIARTNELPIFVALRQIADFLTAGGTLEDYILDVLENRAGTRNPRALFRRLLLQGRVVVLLDGLDEIPGDSYGKVKAAIHAFTTRRNDAKLPTSMARIVMSCRRQNFLQIREDWLGDWFSAQYYAVSPLQESDIRRFVEKRASDFPNSRTPHGFLADVQASGTLELHRVPLLLSISLGLYTHLPGYEIPHSVGSLYSEMLTELLRRHDFRNEEQLRQNTFRADDKLRFLREFALSLTTRSTPFADFRYSDIVDFCLLKQPTMTRLRKDEAEDFVDEIIDRSGLLTTTSDEGLYAYAHRSIHEYLIAARLVREPAAGASHLLTVANDPEWHQVAVFFSGMDNPQAASFLKQLQSINAVLACQCLATAIVNEQVATDLIRKTRWAIVEARESRKDTLPLFAALIQASHSPKEAVRRAAFDALWHELERLVMRNDRQEQRRAFSEIFGGDSPVAAKLLQTMSSTSLGGIPNIILQLARVIPENDPALVAPLWHALSMPNISHPREAREIVQRLLVLAMDPRCFRELQSLPPIKLSWVPESHRRAAYPLKNGLPRSSNLVALLGCAYTLRAFDGLSRPNAYIAALQAPGQPLATLEQRPNFRSRLLSFKTVRIFAYLTLTFLAITAVPAFLVLFSDEPPRPLAESLTGIALAHIFLAAAILLTTWNAVRRYQDHAYYGRFSNWAYLIPAGYGPMAALTLPQSLGLNHQSLRAHTSSLRRDLFILPFYLVASTIYLPISALYAVLWVAIAPLPILLGAGLGAVHGFLSFWLPATELLGKYGPYSWRSSSRYRRVYTDPRSKHWMLPRIAEQYVPPRSAQRPTRGSGRSTARLN
ncbi:NACHT domain-containing protein [Micromonospora zamorensis]|uniref:NACHT domain-containing protein n=1 Tax=Micromonospora zamorensis TaxID=709883 RepID=UPI0033E66DDE